MRLLTVLPLIFVSLLSVARVEAAPGPLCPVRRTTMALFGRPSLEGALLAGAQPGATEPHRPPQRYIVGAGDTLSGLAARFGTSVAALVAANQLTDPDRITAGQSLLIPATNDLTLPYPFKAVWRAAPAVQGQAVLLWVEVAPGTTVRGRFGDQSIPFRPYCGLRWGLVALGAMLPPGLHLIELTATTPDGVTATAGVPLAVEAGGYNTETIWLDPATQRLLDPGLIRAENQRLNALIAELDGPPLWQGPFQRPMTTPVTSLFGTRRSWNGGPANSYHEGIDYDGEVGDEIRAAAAGRVILAERLTVRGNTVFLDHGAGVVSGYFHMSELAVETGQVVQAGDLLGKVGATGLVTGPHLHWELRVNGRWVDPGPWLTRVVP